ncbi:putative DUF4261 family protein [Corynebacterium mustelae]|uniref:Putative DUF4261 family protein n=1 Tax=Corynebacterium mustelae TaxID=571915 RepID=A0A0G3GVJ9_9CORY|nr:DUF4261 domain-containing protein [Corynebacterium mustelae]AKK05176.1 putative DUF4261 family protein [Corynebacterium mustelae]
MLTQDLAGGPVGAGAFTVDFYWGAHPKRGLDLSPVVKELTETCAIGTIKDTGGTLLLEGFGEKYGSLMPPMLMFSDITEVDDPDTIIDSFERTQLWRLGGREDEALALMNFTMGMTELHMPYASADFPPVARLEVYAAAIRGVIRSLRPDVVRIVHSGDVYFGSEMLQSLEDEQFQPAQLAVNIRSFNVAGKAQGEFLMDSLGAYLFDLPDVQVHAHTVDQDEVAGLVFGIVHYVLDEGDVFNDGDTVGVEEYKVQHEMSLVQPPREVIDVHFGEFAAGNR